VTAHDFRIARDRVAGQPADEAAWLAIEKIYDELKLPSRPDNRFNELTHGQRAVYVLHWVQSEIRNGGFEQLYFNSTGRFAALAPAAARQVGADEYAAVFARANSLFADGSVPEQAGRRRQALRDVLDERRDELDAIENDFFTLLGQTDVYDHLGRYVLENPEDFFLE
jgi:prepilin-type processing-associated H-X9-DG protein